MASSGTGVTSDPAATPAAPSAPSPDVRRFPPPVAWAARAGPATWAVGVAAVGLLARLPLLFDPYHRFTAPPDTATYLALADEIQHGAGLLRNAGGVSRTPGYPLLIIVLDALPGSRQDAVVVAQHLIGVGLAVGVLLIGWHFFGRAPAIIAALLVAVSPQLIGVEHDVLTDYLLGATAFLGAAALAAGVSRMPPSGRWLAAAGLLFGVATLIRPSGQALVLAAPIVVALATRNLRATLRGTVVVTAAMALFVVPWIVRNAVHDDAPTLSVKGYQALFMRVFDQDHLPFATSGPDTRVAEAIYARDPAPPGVTTNRVFDVLTALMQRDQTLYEASRSEAEMAAGAIVASPFAYAKGTVRNLGALTLTADPVRASNSVADLESYRTRAGPTTPGLVRTPLGAISRVLWRAGEVLCVLSWVFVAAWVVSLFSLRVRSERSAALGAFAVVWLLVVGVTASAAIPDRRFGAQGLALFWLVGAVGFVLTVRTLWARFADRRPAGPAA